MGQILKLDPKDTNRCFGCGGANDAGMKLAFVLDFDDRRAVVLDEAMGKLSRLAQEQAVTAEMNIEFRKPVPVDKEIVVEGWQEEEKGRNRFRVAEIRDPQGNLLARGKGRFVVVEQSHFTGTSAAKAIS